MPIQPSDIVRIELEPKAFCYAKALLPPLACFYDRKTSTSSPSDDLGALLFKVWVSKPAWKNKRWVVVSHKPLTDAEQTPPIFFKKDKIDGSYYLYSGNQFSLATKSECAGLECAAVWDDVHIEERLRAHFSGERSIWTDALRCK